MFTAPAMCEALRQLSPGSVPDQLRQAELSMRERERRTCRQARGMPPTEADQPSGAAGTRPGGAGHTAAAGGRPSQRTHSPIVSRTSGRHSIRSGCTELPSAALSTCRPQGTFSGPSRGQSRAVHAFATGHGDSPPGPFSFCSHKLSDGIHVRVVVGDALRGAYGATSLSPIFIA